MICDQISRKKESRQKARALAFARIFSQIANRFVNLFTTHDKKNHRALDRDSNNDAKLHFPIQPGRVNASQPAM